MTDPMTPDREQLRQQITEALHGAGAYCGECNFEDDSKTCPECIEVRGRYVDAVLPVVDAAGTAPLRRLLPKMAELRDRLKSRQDPAAAGVSFAIQLTRVLAEATEAGEEW